MNVFNQELLIKTKITKSMFRLGERTRCIKKPYKYSFVKNVHDAYYEMLRLCVAANMTKGSKKTYQHKMDIQLEILRAYIDTAVSKDIKLISPGLHKVWSRELYEIGCLLGGWIASTK